MKWIFADAFYFMALLNESDDAHDAAANLNLDAKLLTTVWILTEVADGMAASPLRRRCVNFLRELSSDREIRIVTADQSLWNESVDFYSRRPDKEWSLTDCISFVVMKKYKIKDALTGDHHFEQAGFNALLKP
jgi:uncharacterized protein